MKLLYIKLYVSLRKDSNNAVMEKIFIEPKKSQSLEIDAHSLTDSSKLVIKRIFDVTLSLLTLVFICSWLFPLIALAIKGTTSGPVFFKQLRHGKDNVPFYCLKFRTMVDNNQADVLQASRNDKRITKVGGFLRRTSLDELPQVINVLKGEMSIVGPRPHTIPMNEIFAQEINNFMFRHAVKPGITGLAQAKGYRGETKDFYDIHSRYKLDMFYVKNWCIYFDSKIILKTVYSLCFNNERAY